MKNTALILCLFSVSLAAVNLASQELTIQGSLEWERMEFNSMVTFDLKKAGIKLPAGRSQAEAILADEYEGLIRPFIGGIQADSSSTLADLLDKGELSSAALMRSVRSLPPALSPDLSSIFARYSVSLNDIGAELIRHSSPQRINAPLIPAPARDYTGIIIIADKELPVHGKSVSALALPCLFPKIWDSDMKLVFERNMLNPEAGRKTGPVRYASQENILLAVPSSLNEDVVKRVGENPLFIMAEGLFGTVPTDPIINKEDALLILSSENNRRLLLEGRIVIVLDKKELKKNIP